LNKAAKFLERLRGLCVDDDEVFALFSFHFREATQSTAGIGSIEFRAPDSPTILVRINYDQGRIKEIQPHTALTTEKDQNAFIEQARIELSPTHGSHVLSRYLFSNFQLVQSFRWKDVLRLRPCNPNARIGSGRDWFRAAFEPCPGSTSTSGDSGPPYPFLMEVRVSKSPNFIIEANRGLKLLDTLQYALSVFLVGDVQYAHFPNGPIWTTQKGDGAEPEYHLVMPGFGDPDGGQHDDFPSITAAEAALYEGGDYYERLWGQEARLPLPTTLEQHLDAVFSLSKEDFNKFRRASYWFALGLQNRNAETQSIPAFSAAIECLLPSVSRNACSECGKPVGPGPTQAFKDHIDKYGQVSAELNKQAATLYAVRSALVHGRHASSIDQSFFSFETDRRWRTLLLWLVTRRSIIGWLEDQVDRR
jgi:hypothetical protein